MKISNVCMNCKREPESFETDEGLTAYYMVIPNGAEDPTVLMSNLELKFIACLDKNFTAKNGEYFMCIKCFEASISKDDNE